MRRVEDGGHRVDDRVLGPYKLEDKVLGEGIPLPGLEREELVVHAELMFPGDLLPDQFGRVRGGDDRALYRWASRDGPDVVEVPVRADNGLDGPLDRVHHRIVRYRLDLDEIKGVHIFYLRVFVDHRLVQAESHVKDDNFLSAADGGHIPPNLVISAHCNNLYIHLVSPVFSSRVFFVKIPCSGVSGVELFPEASATDY